MLYDQTTLNSREFTGKVNDGTSTNVKNNIVGNRFAGGGYSSIGLVVDLNRVVFASESSGTCKDISTSSRMSMVVCSQNLPVIRLNAATADISSFVYILATCSGDS